MDWVGRVQVTYCCLSQKVSVEALFSTNRKQGSYVPQAASAGNNVAKAVILHHPIALVA